MVRPQFTLKTLLWLMAVVAAFLGGMEVQKKIEQRRRDAELDLPLVYPDEKRWQLLIERKRRQDAATLAAEQKAKTLPGSQAPE